MPEIDWSEPQAAQRAAARILQHKPVILQMPEGFDAGIDWEALGCEPQGPDAVLSDCDGGKVLRQLAMQNHLPDLDIVAAACIRADSHVDVDRVNKRLTVHD